MMFFFYDLKNTNMDKTATRVSYKKKKDRCVYSQIKTKKTCMNMSKTRRWVWLIKYRTEGWARLPLKSPALSDVLVDDIGVSV